MLIFLCIRWFMPININIRIGCNYGKINININKLPRWILRHFRSWLRISKTTPSLVKFLSLSKSPELCAASSLPPIRDASTFWKRTDKFMHLLIGKHSAWWEHLRKSFSLLVHSDFLRANSSRWRRSIHEKVELRRYLNRLILRVIPEHSSSKTDGAN